MKYVLRCFVQHIIFCKKLCHGAVGYKTLPSAKNVLLKVTCLEKSPSTGKSLRNCKWLA